MPSFQVTNDVKERLDVGNAVIQRVRQMLAYGQANQLRGYGQTGADSTQAQQQNAALQDRYAAVNEGWNHLKVQKSSSFFGYYTTKTTSLDTTTTYPTNLDRPQRVGGIALHMQVGNCQEFASVSYLLLRTNLSSSDRVVYTNGQGPHWYCLITDPGVTITSNADVPDDAVVVDPWIVNQLPEALLWQHSIHKVRYPVVRAGASKLGTASARNAGTLNEGKAQDARNKYSSSDVQSLTSTNTGKYQPGPYWNWSAMASRVGPVSHLWDEVWLWNGGTRYDYTTLNPDDVVINLV
jgi:hypothetical protein